MRLSRPTVRRAAVLILLAALTGCTNHFNPPPTEETFVTTEAPRLDIDSCPSDNLIDGGGHLYPSLAEGTLPSDAAVQELMWCHLYRNAGGEPADQVVERRTSSGQTILDEVRQPQLTAEETGADCSMAIHPEPALFALTDRGTYRVSLPRHPECRTPTLTVSRPLDANDSRWRITDVFSRDNPR